MHKGLARLGNQRFFGSSFSPGISLPEIQMPDNPRIEVREEQPTQEIQTLQGIIFSRLMAAQPESEQLQKEKQMWMSRAAEYAALDAFLEECKTERSNDLLKQHKQIRKQGRAQTSLVQKLEAEFNAANASWNDLSLLKSKALDAVGRMQYQREHLGRFASDEEIYAAENKVEKAKSLAREAIQMEDGALAERNETEERFLQAKGELARITGEEVRIRAQLEGRPYRDPELGLEVRP